MSLSISFKMVVEPGTSKWSERTCQHLEGRMGTLQLGSLEILETVGVSRDQLAFGHQTLVSI